MEIERVVKIYKKNKFLFFKKTFLKLIRIFYSSFFLPLSIILFLFILIIKLFITIRISSIPTSRIGHLSGNVDLYLCHKKYIQKEKTLDIFFRERFISNYFLYQKWKKKLYVGNRIILNQILFFISFFNLKKHQIKAIETDRDFLNIRSKKVDLNLEFSLTEEEYGYSVLENFGVKKSDKIVCLVSRDEVYLNKTHPEMNWDYHNYRNSEIKNYKLAAEELANRGYFVFRMGLSNKEKLISNNKRVIDYSFSKFRSEFMDIFLSSKCNFAISSSLGLDGVFQLFHKPIAFVNMVPLAYLQSYYERHIFLFKKHFSLEKNRNLSLNEIFDLELAIPLNTENFKKKGVKLIENSPEEIRDTAIELDDRINKRYVETFEQQNLQEKFRQLYEENLKKYNFRHMHGKLLALHSSNFLKSNDYFIE